jgi:uncharacterized protein YndB with AHSA1/START domain
MSQIEHEIKVKASAEQITQALTNTAQLEAWHGGKVTAVPGGMRFDFADGAPTFEWAVDASRSPREIIWRCVRGPGDSAGTDVSFKISPADKERTLVELIHDGWPHTRGNYRKCNTQWAILLHHLRAFLETGKPGPALKTPR